LAKFPHNTARTRLAAGHDNLILPVARTEVRKNSFAVRVVSKWNRLPEEIKMSRTAEEFKRRIKSFYKSTCVRPQVLKKWRQKCMGQPRDEKDDSLMIHQWIAGGSPPSMATFLPSFLPSMRLLVHAGIRVTCRLIASHYLWPGLAKDVAAWCNDCKACQRIKSTM
jgi:hypothetical protein